MDLVFLGGVYHDEWVINKSRGKVHNAANLLQWNIINGIEKSSNIEMKVVNSYFTKSYPFSNKILFFKNRKWSHNSKKENIDVGFINLFGFSHLTKKINIYKTLKKWALDGKSDKNIIIYSMYSPFISAVKKLKNKWPEIKISIVVPDLPVFMNLSKKKNYFYKILKSLDSAKILKDISVIDKYILLTKSMADYLNIPVDKYIVIEGMVNVDHKIEFSNDLGKEIKSRKIIMYSGSLNQSYGIVKLLDAFSLIDDRNAELHIYGTGDSMQLIKEKMKNDDRIKYFGLVKQTEIHRAQQEATVLVNPRDDSNEYTKYSFPSKLMEYLISGRPVISYMLPGFPEEYRDYIIIPTDNTIEKLAYTINSVINLNHKELSIIGGKSKKYILENKNNVAQCKKIMEFIQL